MGTLSTRDVPTVKCENLDLAKSALVIAQKVLELLGVDGPFRWERTSRKEGGLLSKLKSLPKIDGPVTIVDFAGVPAIDDDLKFLAQGPDDVADKIASFMIDKGNAVDIAYGKSNVDITLTHVVQNVAVVHHELVIELFMIFGELKWTRARRSLTNRRRSRLCWKRRWIPKMLSSLGLRIICIFQTSTSLCQT